jgi:hypothetical protein
VSRQNRNPGTIMGAAARFLPHDTRKVPVVLLDFRQPVQAVGGSDQCAGPGSRSPGAGQGQRAHSRGETKPACPDVVGV